MWRTWKIAKRKRFLKHPLQNRTVSFAQTLQNVAKKRFPIVEPTQFFCYYKPCRFTAEGGNAKASYMVEEGKYMVYAFNPDYKGVEEWKVYVIE